MFIKRLIHNELNGERKTSPKEDLEIVTKWKFWSTCFNTLLSYLPFPRHGDLNMWKCTCIGVLTNLPYCKEFFKNVKHTFKWHEECTKTNVSLKYYFKILSSILSYFPFVYFIHHSYLYLILQFLFSTNVQLEFPVLGL